MKQLPPRRQSKCYIPLLPTGATVAAAHDSMCDVVGCTHATMKSGEVCVVFGVLD